MECKACLVVDCYLKRLLHEFLAGLSDALVKSGREHEHLLLVRSHLEDGLYIPAHVKLVQHFVALVEDEVLQLAQVEVVATDQRQKATWSTYEDLRRILLQLLDVLGDGLSTVHDINIYFRQVLSEPVILLLDLESQFSGVTHHKH